MSPSIFPLTFLRERRLWGCSLALEPLLEHLELAGEDLDRRLRELRVMHRLDRGHHAHGVASREEFHRDRALVRFHPGHKIDDMRKREVLVRYELRESCAH